MPGASSKLSARQEALAREITESWPALSFHYGLSYSELRQMPRYVRRAYAEKLEELMAQAQLRAIEAAAWPNMKQDSQRRMIRDLSKRAEKSQPKPAAQKPKSADDMAKAAATYGFGVYVDGESSG